MSIIPLGEPCFCPPVWHGVVAPYCPTHNPGTTWTGASTITTWPPLSPRLSDEDVERIADRVAEKLAAMPRRKRRAPKKTSNRSNAVAEMLDASGTKIITDADGGAEEGGE